MAADSAARSWDSATPDEIRDARIQALEESVQHLKECVTDALRYGRDLPHAAEILDEEWSK